MVTVDSGRAVPRPVSGWVEVREQRKKRYLTNDMLSLTVPSSQSDFCLTFTFPCCLLCYFPFVIL